MSLKKERFLKSSVNTKFSYLASFVIFLFISVGWKLCQLDFTTVAEWNGMIMNGST